MKLQQAISSYKRTWALGNCLKAFLMLLCIFVITIILYGLADALWALNNDTRAILNKAIIATAVLASLWFIIKILKTKHAEVATLADASTDNSSKNIRAAYDLSLKKSTSPLQTYLSEEAQQKAAENIKNISLKKMIPVKGIAITSLGIMTALAVGYSIRIIHAEAYDTVTQRLIHPDLDIPPYSPLVFQITQDSPNTIYGGENQVRVEITGGEIKDEIVCRVRDKQTGKIETLHTFKESSKTFSKKFTNVLHDFQFSFATGKASSKWHDVAVILQPKFSTATVKVTPPAYTKQPTLEFPLEGNEISVINGSEISLTITSNRPLSGGKLTLTSKTKPDVGGEHIKPIINSTRQKQVTFTWLANNSSSISCLIKDIRNTASANALEFDIITRADLAPAADLVSPARRVLATPSSTIPIRGIVEDDYEVDNVYLVRTLVGFRDRATELASDVDKVQYDFEQKIDLDVLGVEPAQTLEFYLEANDKNPNLLGVGLSDVVRVEIISEEDYAERIRNSTKLKQFNIRYRILTKAIREATTSLRELKEENLKNEQDSFEAKLKVATDTHINSYQLALKIAQDFEAYKLEATLTELAEGIADKLITNHSQLLGINFDTGPDANEREINEMIERLGASLELAEQLQQEADEIQAVGEVMKQAAIFKKLLNQQESITSRIVNIAKQLQRGIRRNAGSIEDLGNTQTKNKEQLLQFAKDLKNHADDLPPEFDQLKADVETWLDEMEELNIPEPMDAATLATTVGKSHEAAEHAFLAYSLMKQLHDMEQNEFAQLIRGETPDSWDDPEQMDENRKQTLEEMLKALHNQMSGAGGNGRPGNGNGGAGGGGNDGGRGGSLLRNSNLPMFGPNRSEFSEGNNAGARGNGGSAKSGDADKAKVSESNTLKSTNRKTHQTSQATRTNIPEKYKDAVKRFYTESESETEAAE